MTEQWGDMANSVSFSPAFGCYVWECIWGCYGFDYEGQGEAERAFVGHTCLGKKS